MGKKKAGTERAYGKIEKYLIAHLPAAGRQQCVKRLRDKMEKLLRGEGVKAMRGEEEVRATYRHYKVKVKDYLVRGLLTSALEARMWIRVLGWVLREKQLDIRREEGPKRCWICGQPIKRWANKYWKRLYCPRCGMIQNHERRGGARRKLSARRGGLR